MFRKVTYLTSFVLVLGFVLASTANAADPDLVGWWKLDETSGTLAEDSSGFGNHGTLQGDVTWATGKIRGAWQGDGTGDYIRVPHNDSLNVNDAVTVALWAWASESRSTDSHQILCKGSGGSAWFSTFGLQTASEWQHTNLGVTSAYCLVFRGTSTPGRGDGFWSATPMPSGEWVHIAVTFDLNAQGNNRKIYINGVVDAEDRATNPLGTNTSDLLIGADAYQTTRYWWDGMLDDIRIYNRALTEAEIQQLKTGVSPGKASDPNPTDKARDVPLDTSVSWTPGEYANTHDVYLGTVFNDVNTAGRANPRGVLASQGQIATTYDPPGRLNFGQTYYWRIDEVNAPPTSTIFKGEAWSFTVEPIAYLIDATSITASASSSNSAAENPANTVNGSGLNADGLHSAANTDMWLSGITGPQPTWIQYEFDKVYKLHQMVVWNYNTTVEPVIGFGVKGATIEYSTDGANWTTLGTTHEFARGTGVAGYAPNTTIDLGGVAAKYVKITANSNWGGMVNQYGLSEVQFFSIPVVAREPDPLSGTTDMGPDVTLSWRAGRAAAKHNVYLSTDQQAVIDGTSPVVTVTSPSYASSLNLAGTYYWRIDEVNDVETPTTWQGDIWSLSTQEYLVVDDFESYNDIEAGKEGSHLVYVTWVDGFGTTTNGSTIGYTEAFQPSVEKTVIYDGKQSVPLFYDNTTASLSEVTANVANLQAGNDWTRYGIKGLTLRFYGDPNNAPQQMYVKVNGKKVLYDGDAQNLNDAAWQMWYVDLTSLGVNLSNVSTLTIGLERIGGLGGQGMILLDGIRLYSYERQLITPAVPDTANLAGHWKFDEGAGTTATDSSAKKNNGTITGAQWVTGRVGGALKFSGAEYVQIPAAAWSTIENQVTIALWANGDVAAQPQAGVIFAAYQDPAVGSTRVVSAHCPWSNGTVFFDTGGSPGGYDRISKAATPAEYEGSWQHWTFIKNADTGEQSIYLNGKLWHSATGMTRPMTGVTAFTIGCHPALSNYYVGMVDDFRLYDRALSPAEVAGLEGLTLPFDKPF